MSYPKLTEGHQANFWRHVPERPEGACWIWRGGLMHNGYGRFNLPPTELKRPSAAAHRLAYELLIGPVPDSLDMDHLCRVRACVNPAHLEPVTRSENLRRSESTVIGSNIRKTHCIRGHSLTDAHIVITKLGIVKRHCRPCRKMHSANSYAKQRQKKTAA